MSSVHPSSYVVCTSPRSGSTLLCELLKATGVAGSPGSHFHAPSLDLWLEAYDLSVGDFKTRRSALRAVFDAARRRGTGATETFGLRMQRGSFDFFAKALRVLHPDLTEDVRRIEAEFGPTVFIHLTRADKLGQAISRVRAEQSGLWHRNADGTEMERLAPPTEPRFDAAAIERHMADLGAQDAEWDGWFAKGKIEPLQIAYADLSDDPRAVITRILEALDLDAASATFRDPPTAKLADAMSADWRRTFAAQVRAD